jgi:hypothetical protein
VQLALHTDVQERKRLKENKVGVQYLPYSFRILLFGAGIQPAWLSTHGQSIVVTIFTHGLLTMASDTQTQNALNTIHPVAT